VSEADHRAGANDAGNGMVRTSIIMGILAKCSRHMSGPSVLSTLHQEWG